MCVSIFWCAEGIWNSLQTIFVLYNIICNIYFESFTVQYKIDALWMKSKLFITPTACLKLDFYHYYSGIKSRNIVAFLDFKLLAMLTSVYILTQSYLHCVNTFWENTNVKWTLKNTHVNNEIAEIIHEPANNISVGENYAKPGRCFR